MSKKTKPQQKKSQIPTWVWFAGGAVLLILLIWLGFSQRNNTETSSGDTAAISIPDEISVQEATEDIANGAFLLDVREQDEWNAGHVEGATLIPLGELSSRVSEVPQDSEVIVMCRTGRRSAEGRDILRQAGYTNVTSMAGGITEWQSEGLPVVTGE